MSREAAQNISAPPPAKSVYLLGGIYLNNTFTCKACGAAVPLEGGGTENRNHCPKCLCSVHLDNVPGDRAADCGAVMDAVAVWVRKNGEWAIIHRCRRCGALSSNRIAADDSPFKLMSIAAKPLAQPPFPIEFMDRMSDDE